MKRTNLIFRILISIFIGILFGILSFQLLHQRGFLASDFQWPLRSGQYILEGKNPYQQVPNNFQYPYDSPYFYPLTTAIFSIPFTHFEPYTAGAFFFGVSSAVLAYAIFSDKWWLWPVFISPCYFIAASVAQWSPMIMAAALLPPAFRALAFLKPSIGIVSFVYKPNVRAIIIILIAICLSLFINPHWPVDWVIAMLSSGNRYEPPLFYPGGFLLALSILSIRHQEGRTLCAMSVVPRHAYWYDGVLLWLLPQNLKQSLALSGLGWIAYIICRLTIPDSLDLSSRLNGTLIWQSIFLYLPALIMVISPDLKHLLNEINISMNNKNKSL